LLRDRSLRVGAARLRAAAVERVRNPLARGRVAAAKRRPHLAIGCVAIGLALAPAGGMAAAAAAAIALAAGAWIFGLRGGLVAAALVAGAAVLGAARIAAIDRPAGAAPPGSVIQADATLLERPRQGLYSWSAPMKIETGAARGLKVLARSSERWPGTDPGLRFRIRGFVRMPADAASGSARAAERPAASAPGGASAPAASAHSPTSAGPAAAGPTGAVPSEANAGAPGTPGFGPLPARADPGDSFDFAAFLRSRGIGRELRVESLEVIGRRSGIAGAVDSMRRRAERGIAAHLPADLGALARGMVLGEDGDIPETTRDDFRRSGLAHLLAASGQNVALLCALALPLLMLAGTSQGVRVAVLLPLVAIYVALAGSGASITRAGIMAAAGLLAIATGRRSSAVYSLLLAAVVTLAINPRATADPGWQLSFAAVAGMLALGPVLQRRLRRLPRPAAEAVGATVAATLATSPLLAHEFGAVSIAALPANLVVFPAVAPIMWIGMGEAALEQPGGPLAHVLEAPAAPVSALALRWVAAVATRFADPSWAQADIQLGWPAVVTIYTALAAAAAVLAKPAFVRRALHGGAIAGRLGELLDWLRALSPASRRAFAAPAVALLVAAAAHAAAAPPAPRHLTIDFIDVGQGDATLIRDSTGAAVLFDGGVPEARVDRTLRRLGVRELSVVVATHQSRDHHAGLMQVVKRFPVALFLDGRYGVRDQGFIALEREVDRRRIPRRPTRAGQGLRVGAMEIRILWPPPPAPGAPPPDNPNERATVAVVSGGGFDLLLSADAESEVLLPLDLPRVDAMKVPHHGSADPGLPQLLERLKPKVAAIETGRGNDYGHPTPQTLDALRGRVPRVYRTDRDGTTELTVSDGRIAIRTHR
jgi:competence protein ComEC